MSEYRAQTTSFRDKDCLVEALMAAGYTRDKIETHDTPQQLYDYHGRPTTYTDKAGDKANIIIRRNNIGYGAANDLGFLWDEKSKTYKAMVSQYDSDTSHWGAEGPRMKATEQAYAELVIAKTAKKQGFKYLGKKIVNGKVQVQYLDMRS